MVVQRKLVKICFYSANDFKGNPVTKLTRHFEHEAYRNKIKNFPYNKR